MKKILILIIIILLAVQVFGKMEIKVDQNGNPILNQFSEEGFVDCVFKIKELKVKPKFYEFHLSASFDNEVVGMDVKVVKGIQGGFDPNMELDKRYVYRKGVVFNRSGVESDRLIVALQKLYGLKGIAHKMISEETFTGIALHQGSLDMESEPIKIKIFGNDTADDLENDYYESFFNLDIKNGFVFWNEKDQEYREPLIRGLSN